MSRASKNKTRTATHRPATRRHAANATAATTAAITTTCFMVSLLEVVGNRIVWLPGGNLQIKDAATYPKVFHPD